MPVPNVLPDRSPVGQHVRDGQELVASDGLGVARLANLFPNSLLLGRTPWHFATPTPVGGANSSELQWDAPGPPGTSSDFGTMTCRMKALHMGRPGTKNAPLAKVRVARSFRVARSNLFQELNNLDWGARAPRGDFFSGIATGSRNGRKGCALSSQVVPNAGRYPRALSWIRLRHATAGQRPLAMRS